MSKHYKLIVGHDFSLSNETDCDIQSDYFPGMWGLKTQKSALKYAKQEIAEGNTISVTDYDNPNYHALANWFIKELGLSQELFKEPEAIISKVTGTAPRKLSDLKRYLEVGKKIKIANYRNGERVERDSVVLSMQSNAFTVQKGGTQDVKSWVEYGKASEWGFTDTEATKYYINREGKNEATTTIIY